MQYLGTWFSDGFGCPGLTVVLNDLKDLFQPNQSYDYINIKMFYRGFISSNLRCWVGFLQSSSDKCLSQKLSRGFKFPSTGIFPLSPVTCVNNTDPQRPQLMGWMGKASKWVYVDFKSLLYCLSVSFFPDLFLQLTFVIQSGRPHGNVCTI